MIAIRGSGSRIAEALSGLLPRNEKLHLVRRGSGATLKAERYLFCCGLLRPQRIVDQSDVDIAETFLVNAGSIIRDCDRIIDGNPEARICVLGSESGFAWSYDGAYAAAKAAVHRYVETKRLKSPDQQLVCIAPGIIVDAGMTMRRTDKAVLEAKRAAHPKGRHILSIEVARLVHHVLYVDRGMLSGVVIRMNGGAHTC